MGQKQKNFVDNQTIFNRLDDEGTGYQNGPKTNQYQNILLRN